MTLAERIAEYVITLRHYATRPEHWDVMCGDRRLSIWYDYERHLADLAEHRAKLAAHIQPTLDQIFRDVVASVAMEEPARVEVPLHLIRQIVWTDESDKKCVEQLLALLDHQAAVIAWLVNERA